MEWVRRWLLCPQAELKRWHLYLICRYHTTLRPAPTAKIQARLKQNPKDKEENIEKRVDAYHRNVRDLQEFYEDAFDINADQDPYPIFEFIESCIIKPLPCKKLNASN